MGLNWCTCFVVALCMQVNFILSTGLSLNRMCLNYTKGTEGPYRHGWQSSSTGDTKKQQQLANHSTKSYLPSKMRMAPDSND